MKARCCTSTLLLRCCSSAVLWEEKQQGKFSHQYEDPSGPKIFTLKVVIHQCYYCNAATTSTLTITTMNRSTTVSPWVVRYHTQWDDIPSRLSPNTRGGKHTTNTTVTNASATSTLTITAVNTSTAVSPWVTPPWDVIPSRLRLDLVDIFP